MNALFVLVRITIDSNVETFLIALKIKIMVPGYSRSYSDSLKTNLGKS